MLYTGGDMKTTDASDETILCISTRNEGHALLRELARLKCRVVLLTLEELRDAGWPQEVLEDLQTMPGDLTQQQITNTVTYLARTRRFARILALGAVDMTIAAALREHMRIPGMGLTTTRYFRDRLAMRAKANHLGIRVPAFTRVLNTDDLHAYMESVPAPWLLRPRCVVSATETQTLHGPEELWRALEELGDRQSDFLLEQAIPGELVTVAGITADEKSMFAAVSGQVRGDSTDERELKSMLAKLLPGLGMVRGVSHTKFLRSLASGKLYFLETLAGPGDTSVVQSIEQNYGVHLWEEWARVEVAALRGESYRLA